MTKLSLFIKSKRKPKFSTRGYHRCELCGRAHAYYRKFRICRLCLRKLAHEGKIPGMTKASW
jgi:small subunit ribosomal protein S14